MINTQFILKINNNEKIIIKHQKSIETINCAYENDIIFRQGTTEIVLSHDFLYHNLEELIVLLKKALANNLSLHSSITKNLGFLFNQYSATICGEKLKEPTYLTYVIQYKILARK